MSTWLFRLLVRLWRRARRRWGLWVLSSLAFIALGQISIVSTLGAFVDGLDRVQTGQAAMAVAAAVYGWWLAGRRWPAFTLVPALGLLLNATLAGSLLEPFIAYLRSLLFWLWSWMLELETGPALESIAFARSVLLSAVLELRASLSVWSSGFLRGQAVEEPAALVFVWGMMVWLLSIWASWCLARLRRPLASFLPALLLVVAMMAIEGSRFFYPVAQLAGLSLLLSASTSFFENERKWHRRKIGFSEELRMDMVVSAVPLVLFAILLGSILPVLSLRPLIAGFIPSGIGAGPGSSAAISGEDLSRYSSSLGLEPPAPPPSPFEQAQFPGLPNAHLIGSGPELGERLVMVIRVEDPVADPSLPYYWRSLTYEIYDGSGWQTGETESTLLRRDVPALQPLSAHERIIRQSVRHVRDGAGLVYAAGNLMRVNQTAEVAWRPPGSREDYFGATVRSNSYWSDSILPTFTAADLLQSSAESPLQVNPVYLALPDTIPDRVGDLADEITAQQATPFGKAQALESYLRTFPYSLDIPQPPAGRDIVDYFLFELQTGYCDYYATSLVVMARAVGLPARLAIGYASGLYDAGNGRYVVSEADAHSWVEIFFPEFGWIPFEPTAGLPAFDRSAEISADPLGPVIGLQPLPSVWAERIRSGMVLMAGLLGLAAAAALAYQLVEGWRILRLAPRQAIIRVYWKVFRPLKGRIDPQAVGMTAWEFASSYSQYMVDLAHVPVLQRLFLPMSADFHALTGLYNRALYGRQAPNRGDRQLVLQLWWQIGYRWWVLRLLSRFRSR